MTETAIIGRNVDVVQAGSEASSPFSWSAAIAGALAAMAISFIVVSLGSGIGLSLTSPYRDSPSLTTLGIAGAIWLVFAQALGFATGGYLSARLRNQFADVLTDETTFRDAAQGLIVWALVVVLNVAVFAMAASGALSNLAQVGSSAVGGAAAGAGNGGPNRTSSDTTGYFVDSLLRSGATPGAGGGASAAASEQNAGQQRAEIGRILAMSTAQGQLSDPDRTYLAQLVSARTGMSQDEARARVDEVTNRMKETAKQAADKAAKAGAYTSFWAFMSLLFGAVSAALGGIVGGELRDQPGRRS